MHIVSLGKQTREKEWRVAMLIALQAAVPGFLADIRSGSTDITDFGDLFGITCVVEDGEVFFHVMDPGEPDMEAATQHSMEDLRRDRYPKPCAL